MARPGFRCARRQRARWHGAAARLARTCWRRTSRWMPPPPWRWLGRRCTGACSASNRREPLPITSAFFDVDGVEAGRAPRLGEDPGVALYAAARGGRVDRALALLDAGADPRALPPAGERDQRSLPLLAAVLPDLRLLRALIGAGVDVNVAHAGMTPLLAATRDSWHGRPEAVMTLLANGADPRAADADGNTPLHHAARSSDPGVAALLRDAAAELDVLNAEGVTPLGMACAAGNWRLARFLLERGAKAEPAGATPALLAAAGSEEDDAAGVQLLLKHKAKVDARDAHGRSALHEAALAGNDDALRALLAAGADVHARDDQGARRCSMPRAARTVAALESLVAPAPMSAALDGEGRGALAFASLAPTRRRSRWCSDCSTLGADPDAGRPRRQARRSICAAEAGRWTLVAALDPAYPLPSRVVRRRARRAPPDRTPLSLLREGLQAAARSSAWTTSLACCRRRNSAACCVEPDAPASAARIEWLLAHGADAEVRSIDGIAATARCSRCSRAARPAGRRCRCCCTTPSRPPGAADWRASSAPAPRATRPARGYEHCALALLERGADPFAASPAGDPPLALAVRLGWMRAGRAPGRTGRRSRSARQPWHERPAPGGRARSRSSAETAGRAGRLAADARRRRADAAGRGVVDGPSRPGRLARLARLAAAQARAAGDRRARRRDRRRCRCGAPPARSRLPGRHRRCPGLHRIAARRRRWPSRHRRPAARARRRSATCRAHRRDAAVGRGEHAPRRNRRPPARRRRRARTTPARATSPC